MVKLTKRLGAVASLVEKGSAVADIGTDHGYVPVWLVQNDIAKSAVAADINELPLASCRELVAAEDLEGKIITRISDGFSAISQDECDTAVIAGMGGEMIADIISRCPYSRSLHLVLQPMTHSEIVRKYLYDNGFEILNDFIVKESRHYYNVLDAKYTGTVLPKSQKDYFFGNITDFSEKGYFIHLYNYLVNKSKSGADYGEIIAALEEII